MLVYLLLNYYFVVLLLAVFKFAPNQHNVQQVHKDSFDACTSSNPIGNSITNIPSNITLNSTGDHYYICIVGRHDLVGQKLAIIVSATTTGATRAGST